MTAPCSYSQLSSLTNPPPPQEKIKSRVALVVAAGHKKPKAPGLTDCTSALRHPQAQSGSVPRGMPYGVPCSVPCGNKNTRLGTAASPPRPRAAGAEPAWKTRANFPPKRGGLLAGGGPGGSGDGRALSVRARRVTWRPFLPRWEARRSCWTSLLTRSWRVHRVLISGTVRGGMTSQVREIGPRWRGGGQVSRGQRGPGEGGRHR